MTNFSATECIKFGWETFKKRPWYLAGVSALYLVISGVVNTLQNHTSGGTHFLAFLVSVGVSAFMGIGVVAFALRAHDNVMEVSLNDAWKPQVLWKYLGAFILYFLSVMGGLILLIIPGLIFAFMFSQTLNLVVDRGMGPMEAMKESKRITTGYKWELFFLALLSVAVAILGALCLLVGLLVAFPVVILAGIHAYHVLSGKADAIVPVAPAPTPPVPTPTI
jgi:uncharacterized membrane protein